jgi:hypothetical protein
VTRCASYFFAHFSSVRGDFCPGRQHFLAIEHAPKPITLRTLLMDEAHPENRDVAHRPRSDSRSGKALMCISPWSLDRCFRRRFTDDHVRLSAVSPPFPSAPPDEVPTKTVSRLTNAPFRSIGSVVKIRPIKVVTLCRGPLRHRRSRPSNRQPSPRLSCA